LKLPPSGLGQKRKFVLYKNYKQLTLSQKLTINELAFIVVSYLESVRGVLSLVVEFLDVILQKRLNENYKIVINISSKEFY
jgi:hypothetical protein